MIVINLKDRKCTRDCVAAKLAGARQRVESNSGGRCRLLALLGPPKMSDLSQQSGAKRTLIRSLSPIAIL